MHIIGLHGGVHQVSSRPHKGILSHWIHKIHLINPTQIVLVAIHLLSATTCIVKNLLVSPCWTYQHGCHTMEFRWTIPKKSKNISAIYNKYQ